MPPQNSDIHRFDMLPIAGSVFLNRSCYQLADISAADRERFLRPAKAHTLRSHVLSQQGKLGGTRKQRTQIEAVSRACRKFLRLTVC
ncbi:hypothetical protein ACVIKO_000263 [Rhizobium ruizarguesonis]